MSKELPLGHAYHEGGPAGVMCRICYQSREMHEPATLAGRLTKLAVTDPEYAAECNPVEPPDPLGEIAERLTRQHDPDAAEIRAELEKLVRDCAKIVDGLSAEKHSKHRGAAAVYYEGACAALQEASEMLLDRYGLKEE